MADSVVEWPGRTESSATSDRFILSEDSKIAAVVQALFRSELGQLKDWLAERLQHQELLLKRLGAPAHIDGLTSSNGNSLTGSKAGASSNGNGFTSSKAAWVSPSAVPDDKTQDLATHLQEAEARSALAKPWSASEAWIQPPQVTTIELVEDLEPVSKERVGPQQDRIAENLPSVQEDTAFWQSQLMDLFDSLDSDSSGTLSAAELQHAFLEVGVAPGRALDVFERAHISVDDEIDRMQWFHVIEAALKSSSGNEDFVKFARALVDAVADCSIKFQKGHLKSAWCIIHVDSSFRTTWDLIIMVLLFYIMMTLPFAIGFEPIEALKYWDHVVDYTFLVDIVLNFRTTYTEQDDRMISNPWKIARRYIQTWFFLDLVSSTPWEIVTVGLMPNMHAARLLKIGKMAKLLRLGKMFKTLGESDLAERFEDIFPRKAYQSVNKMLYLVSITAVICHWLACFMAAIDGDAIDTYLGSVEAISTRYLAALYWALATLTSVGYGDLIPVTDGGRGFTIVSMIIGGTFYGYIVGSITSVVTSMDIDRRAYNERMEMFESWLDHNDRLPPILRRRIRRSFKSHWYARTTVDDSTIINDLSRELRADAAYFLINERVRSNPLFCDLHSSSLATLVDVLRHSSAEKNESIVNIDDPGTAMYIIVDGMAKVTEGEIALGKDSRLTKNSSGLSRMNSENKVPKLIPGDSFGEEILFGVAESYVYTIKAVTLVSMHELPEDDFKKRFKNLPDLLQHMRAKFEALSRDCS